MKKIIVSILIIIFTITFTNAQEGYVKYDIEMSSESPEVSMGLAMMKGSEMEILFKGNDSKIKMNMGSFMTIETVTKNNSDVLLLMSGIIGKRAIKTTKKELEESEGGAPNFSVVFEEGVKTILGYTCKKAIVSVGDATGLIFWYTDKIQMPNDKMLNANGKVPGMILSFESSEAEVNMSFIATKVESKIDATVKFSLEIPEGYTEQPFEDFKKMSGGM